MEQSPVVTCTICEIEPEASSYCAVCEEFLCKDCSMYHGKMRKTKIHKLEHAENDKFLKTFNELIKRRKKDTSSNTAETTHATDKSQEVDPIERAMYEIHETDKSTTTMYCVNCDEEISSLCTKSDKHASHEFLNMHECIDQFKDMLNSSMPEFVAYQKKANDAVLDLEAKIHNTLGSHKVRILRDCMVQLNLLQKAVLQFELEWRKEIVTQTLDKAKELHMKSTFLKGMQKKNSALMNMLQEGDDNKLFSNRKSLTKDYFKLRENTGILLDNETFNEYIERDWSFQIDKTNFEKLLENFKTLKLFIYTKDGLVPQEEMENRILFPVAAVPVKPNSIESIFEQKYRYNDNRPNGTTEAPEEESTDLHQEQSAENLNQMDSTSSNGDASTDFDADIEMRNLEIEALEKSVQNEYNGFDKLKELNNHQEHDKTITEKTPPPPLSVEITRASPLPTDEKDKNHLKEGDRLSNNIADKIHGFDKLKELNSHQEQTQKTQVVSTDTPLGSPSGEKAKNHSEEGDRLSYHVASKIRVQDGSDSDSDSNSEYDPFVQTAIGVMDVGKRRRTFSGDSEAGDGREELNESSTMPGLTETTPKKRGRKSKLTPVEVDSGEASVQVQPTRKSSRTLNNPRPGLILLPKTRRASRDEKEKKGSSPAPKARRASNKDEKEKKGSSPAPKTRRPSNKDEKEKKGSSPAPKTRRPSKDEKEKKGSSPAPEAKRRRNSASSPSTDSKPTPKKKGRPPGSKNKVKAKPPGKESVEREPQPPPSPCVAPTENKDQVDGESVV